MVTLTALCAITAVEMLLQKLLLNEETDTQRYWVDSAIAISMKKIRVWAVSTHIKMCLTYRIGNILVMASTRDSRTKYAVGP